MGLLGLPKTRGTEQKILHMTNDSPGGIRGGEEQRRGKAPTLPNRGDEMVTENAHNYL